MTWTNAMRTEARFMYEKQDAELEEIAEKVGKNVAGVRMVLVKMGIYEKQTPGAAEFKKQFADAYASVGPALF